jgi:hypothetical protein
VNEESRPGKGGSQDNIAPPSISERAVRGSRPHFEFDDETGELLKYEPSEPSRNGAAPQTHGGSDVSGKRSQSGSPCGLEDVLDAFDELMLLPDHGAVYVALAGVVANYADGDVVWPLLVGPSGSGKSEIVNAVRDAPHVKPLSSLTPQTLLSGFERKGEPASLLLQIGEFGILAFKDLTTVLTMHREARGQIIGQLREVADGKTEKSFGNGLRIAWEGKLGLIAGVTPIIDEQHNFLAVMGERFLLYRLPEVSRRDIARRSLARRGHEPELRQRMRVAVRGFLEQFQGCGRLELPERFNERLIELSDIITRAGPESPATATPATSSTCPSPKRRPGSPSSSRNWVLRRLRSGLTRTELGS